MDPAANDRPATPVEPNTTALQSHQTRLVGRALLLAMIVVGGFALFDLVLTGYWLHATIELSACVVFAAVAWQLRRGAEPERVLFPGTLAVAVVILVVVVSGKPADGILVWAALYPPIPFFLHGLRMGLTLSAGFGLLLTAAIGARVVVDPGGGLEWVAPFNVAGAVGASTALAYVYESAREQTAQALDRAANFDVLTGIANRRGFQQGFACRMQLARRSARPISLLVLDIDRLKLINDTAGHRAGDALIRHQVEIIRERIRAQDLLGRIGGDELALLLPDTDLDGAVILAESLLQTVRNAPIWFEGRLLAGSLSIGAAQATPPGEDFDSLFAAADAGLYQAKEGGRDRVVAVPRISLAGRRQA
jgi:diguanylate cyclase (GGDEF)-like protein